MFLDLFCIISVYLRSICEIIKRKEHYINYPICHCCEEQSGRQQWLYNEKAPNNKNMQSWDLWQRIGLSFQLQHLVGGWVGGWVFFVNMNILIWFKCPGIFEGRKEWLLAMCSRRDKLFVLRALTLLLLGEQMHGQHHHQHPHRHDIQQCCLHK